MSFLRNGNNGVENFAENEPADYASDFFYKKIAAYPIVETDVESPQIKHRMF